MSILLNLVVVCFLSIMTQNKEWLSCTVILYIMTISGMAVNYMLRMNITIAIVGMVQPPNSTTMDPDKFQWTTMQKNEILAIFFWGYSLTTFIGGRFSEKYGTRIVFGSALLGSSIMTLFFPILCDVSYYCAIASRFIMGVCLGVTYPSILPLAVSWIPPSDRSKFMSNLGAAALGIAITLPVCGLLITYLGWKSVFYVTGSVGLIWCILWFSLIYDSPEVHLRISEEEKMSIKNKMKEEMAHTGSKPTKTPWMCILKSKPIWAAMVGQMCSMFYTLTVTSQLPTYMNDVLHFKIAKNGLVSCLPHLSVYIFGCIFAYVTDQMIKSKKISLENTRRIFVILSHILPGLLMYLLAFYEGNNITAVAIITIMNTFKGASVCSIAPNFADIAPNYAGTIMGSSMMVGSMGGWLGNKMVGLITKEESSFETWKIVFVIIASVHIFGGVFFAIFVSGKKRSWNQVKATRSELKPISQ